MSYVTIDFETTITNSYKRKANPFNHDNWVVMAGWKHKGGAVQSAYWGKNRPPRGWLIPIIGDAKLIITFNGKFDILHAMQDSDNIEFWQGWVAGGGRLFCCQLAEYLLNGMAKSEHMLSLNEVAPRYGGNVKVDEVKALWTAGVNTPDIEPTLLTRYLCGGLDENGEFQLGDVENTELIALAQIERARQCGQLNSILLNMGALLYTVEAERNGMFVERTEGYRLAALLEQAVSDATSGLSGYLPPDLPFDFNWGSPIQRSALFFGGTVQYDCREYDLKDGTTTWTAPPEQGSNKYAYAKRDTVQWLLNDGKSTTTLDPLDADDPIKLSQYARYTSGKNAGEYKTKHVKVDDYSKPKSRIVKRPFSFKGYTKPDKKWAGADPGVWSTSSDVVAELGTRGIPFLKMYAELMGMSKDLGTYYIRTDAETGRQTGMLTLVNAEGIIHHKLNMTSTVTARLSSSDPNL